jgi:hypothetical protein
MDTTTEPTALTPQWGYKSAAMDAVAAWGARAIYTHNRSAYEANHTKAGKIRKRGRVPWMHVELLWDRMEAVGDADAAKKLTAWLDKVALPKLRAEIELDTTEGGNYTIEDNDFTLHASPRSSYGYLYMTAWVR